MKTSAKEIKPLQVFFIYFSVLVYLEVLLRLFTVEYFFNIGLLYLLAFSACGALFFVFLSSIFRGKAEKTVVCIIIFVTAFFYGSQIVYKHMMQTYYTPYSFFNSGQVANFIGEIFIGIWECIIPVLLTLIPIILLIVYIIRKIKFRKVSLKKVAVILVASIAAYGITIGITFIGDRGHMSPNDLIFKTDNLKASVTKLGMGPTMLLQTQRLIFGFDPEIKIPAITISAASSQKGTAAKEANVMDIDFNRLIKEEDDAEMQQMHRYFSTAEPTYKNEKTGMFEGKNLIYITAESLWKYAIDEKHTPTLYKMQQQGFNFTNFYDPLWDVSTVDGEYVNTVGLIPKSGVWSLKEAAHNWLPFAPGNQFKKLGVKTWAYHDYRADYYERKSSHPNLGYDSYQGMGDGLDVTDVWPPSDLEMIELSVDDYLDQDRFHVYYITVSGHMDYSFATNSMSQKNRESVEDMDLPEESKAYIACNIELDKAMEKLLKELEDSGHLEDTVIVISPDHYPYGLQKKSIDALVGHEADEEFEVYQSSLIIYNAGMKPETVDKYCSSLDILPTISNLFGFEYDSRLLSGQDVFSDAEPLVIFNSRNWITDKAKYTAITGEVEALTDQEVTENYVERVNQVVSDKFNLSRLILDKDYYRKVIPQW